MGLQLGLGLELRLRVVLLLHLLHHGGEHELHPIHLRRLGSRQGCLALHHHWWGHSGLHHVHLWGGGGGDLLKESLQGTPLARVAGPQALLPLSRSDLPGLAIVKRVLQVREVWVWGTDGVPRGIPVQGDRVLVQDPEEDLLAW